MKRIKELIDGGYIYGAAEYDYKYEWELKQQDKQTIIESYYDLFRLVRSIKEVVDKEIQ